MLVDYESPNEKESSTTPPAVSKKRSHQIPAHLPDPDEVFGIKERASSDHRPTKTATVLPCDDLLFTVQKTIHTFETQYTDLPTEAERKRRADAAEWLQKLLEKELAPHKLLVKVFGSTDYDFFLQSSDLDLNAWSSEPVPNFFRMLKAALQKHTDLISHIEIVENSRIAVAKYDFKALHVDLVHQCGSNSDFEHAKQISSWVQKWTERYPFLKTLSRIVKVWAQKNDLNSPYTNTLPTLAFLVMLFSVTETVASENSSAGDAKKLKVDFSLLPAKILCTFFSNFPNWNRKEVVRTRDCVSSLSVDELRATFSERDSRGSGFGEMVFVQDPFLQTINLGRFVTQFTWPRLQRAFAMAHETLFRTGDIHDLLQKL